MNYAQSMNGTNNERQVRVRGLRGFVAGAGIMIMYMASRYVVYQWLTVTNFWEWWLRDSLMNIPRLAVFCASLGLGVHLWGRTLLGWHGSQPALGIFTGIVSIVFTSTINALGSDSFNIPWYMFVALCCSSVLVALAEETLFRGVLFAGLLEWRGIASAIWGSAALFTIYHVQAQRVVYWPETFIAGLLLSLMRSQGVGLFWLIAGHAAADSVIFVFPRTGPYRCGWCYGLVILLEVAVVAVWYVCSRRKRLTA